MKTIIFAGGWGTRLGQLSELIPKPMVQIGGRPILWHIMKIYSHYGFNDFVIALGYKGEIIKDYFLKYSQHHSNLTIDLKNDKVTKHNKYNEDWIINLISTGNDSFTGNRIKKTMEHIGKERVMLTYGDGLSNININKLLEFHLEHKKLATLTAVRPTARFGELKFNGSNVTKFSEKPITGEGWVNGGFFVLEPEVLDYINEKNEPFEASSLEKLSSDGQLHGYKHEGFWHAMDIIRDKNTLNEMWKTNKAPWKIW